MDFFITRSSNGIPNIAFEIFGAPIAWYGVIIFIGFMVAAGCAFAKAHWWYKIPIEPMLYCAVIAIPLAILGARAWSFAIGDAEGNFFLNFFSFENGGLAIHGGIFATFTFGLIFFPLVLKLPAYQVRTSLDGKEQVRRVSSYVYADCILPAILIGQVIGRWGNWVNGEVFGAVATPEELEWLKNVMPLVYQGMIINGVLYQPLFLYESFANFWVFIFLFIGMEFVPKRKAGDIGALYFVFYGIVRAIMEPLRFGDFKFETSLVIAILMLIGGVAFILYNHLYLVKHRDTFILYKCYKKFQVPFKKLYYNLSTDFKSMINKYDPNWKNWGNKKPLKIHKEANEIFFYNGI
ncbi:MAG: prolipoprotein diacylglyceryl transferase [Mycoplasmoidaceae bacterium]